MRQPQPMCAVILAESCGEPIGHLCTVQGREPVKRTKITQRHGEEVCKGHRTALMFIKLPPLYSLFSASGLQEASELSQASNYPPGWKLPIQVVGRRKKCLPGHAACAKVRAALCPITLEKCC